MTATTPTVWLTPSPELRARLGISDVPLPVSTTTSAMMRTDRLEPAAIAIDVDAWLSSTTPPEPVLGALRHAVAALAYTGALALLDRQLHDEAADLLRVGLRHAPDDVSLLAHLAIAEWDAGLGAEGLSHLTRATLVSQQAGRIVPLLWIFTARALSEAGRHAAALELLEQLADTEPHIPAFWDLLDTIGARASSAIRPTVGANFDNIAR